MPPTKSVFISIPTVLGQEIAQLQSSGSPITDFSEGSGIRDILEATAVVISGQSQVADQLQLDSYLDTATEEALDAQGGNWGVPRLAAVQATGQVKITRASSVGALVIPAGWGQLTVPPAAPGAEGVAVLTTADAEFADGQASATIAAQAVLGGKAGNIAMGTKLTPVSPITGVSSSEGFEVASSFTGGVNEETDDAYRARIPLVVQGRVKGKKVSFEGSVLSVPGVVSVGVIAAGGTRGDGSTVPEGHVEVYYQGAVGLLAQVEAAVEEAATLNQKAFGFASVSLAPPRGQLRLIFKAKVVFAPGSVAASVKAAVARVVQEYVEKVGIGGTVYYSEVVEAIHQLPEVISIELPIERLCLFGETTAANVVAAADSYPHLAEADTTITVEEL